MSDLPVAIDCFAGAGGFAFGLLQAGFRLGAAFDWNTEAVRTHRHNLGDHVLEADASTLHGDMLLAKANLYRGDPALVVGGPPCQGFSRQRRGSNEDDRNQLVLDFIRLVGEMEPEFFIMENVAAIRNRRGKAQLSQAIEFARTLGYRTDVNTLNAADFGVPQHRKRAFLVGERVDRPKAFIWPEPTHNSESWSTVRDAIGDLPCPFARPEAASRIPNHNRDNISAQNRRRISHVPMGGGRADIPEELRLPCHRVSVEKAGHRGVYGRLHWDKPAGTITTKCNSFTRGRFAHPVADRNITMREAARLQSFPDDFIFVGKTVPTAHQVGNAVPPLLARRLGEAVLVALERRRTGKVVRKGIGGQLSLGW